MSRYSYDSVTDTLKLISGATQANDIYISGIEDSSTASQAYTVGSYLIYSKVLYKVILAIAQGDTLAPGTNIQSTRVADEINSHLCVDGNEFYFDSHDGKFGYNTSPSRGADTFSPFSGEIDFSYIQYGTGSITYTFTVDLEEVYIGCHVNSPTTPGTYTGSGTKTFISGRNWARSEKIVNVKAGDKYATGAGAQYSTGTYIFMYMVGRKA